MILFISGFNTFFSISTNDQVTSIITDYQAPHKPAVCLPARSIKKGIHVCLCVYSTTFNHAYLHPKWQQTPVWKVPQGGGVFLKLYCGPKTLLAVSHDLWLRKNNATSIHWACVFVVLLLWLYKIKCVWHFSYRFSVIQISFFVL